MENDFIKDLNDLGKEISDKVSEIAEKNDKPFIETMELVVNTLSKATQETKKIRNRIVDTLNSIK